MEDGAESEKVKALEVKVQELEVSLEDSLDYSKNDHSRRGISSASHSIASLRVIIAKTDHNRIC